MTTPERARMADELQMETQRGTMFTVLLHHATASKAGMNVTDAQCVNALSLDGPQTPGQLAQLMGITTGGAITAVIDRLEKAGYVRRTRDPDDRRRVIVEPVEENLARFGRYFAPIGRHSQERLEGYSDEQIAFLLEWIRANNAMMPKVIEEIRNLP
ncbi:MarR family winged helix-turn-helix transcriptional regulator [Actinomadura sp. NEAU-AAG7]|uniref:MarR family winged helix-turn-helix transcriptional regulator n=1 Tax=Actinomadura sp. NEAU-AAG7 TaxID=2839640 RepID=UPI001BE41A13|nr:MarR family transcriptional regulator [Actinomadura sp. NEAU-AAG7]MBT2210786.1 MarR family transcriptional regulator [Actinomadura sp. NEAU-AAG7]